MRNRTVIRFILLAAFMLLTSNIGLSFERKVMVEEFTSTTCGVCANIAGTVHGIFEEWEEDAIPLAYHVNYPNPRDDPWYVDNPDDNQSRMGYYGINSTPRFFMDGTLIQYNSLSDAIEDRLEVDSPLQIQMRGFIDDNGLNVSVEVTSEADLEDALTGLTLHVALKEEYYDYRHRTNQEDHYNAMVKMLPDGDGTEFEIEADETLEFTFEEDMDDWGWHELDPENLSLVAFVQDLDDDVLQAEAYDLSNAKADVSITDVRFSDTDDDGRGEPGETLNIYLTLANAETALDAENITVSLTIDDESVALDEDEIAVDAISRGDETMIEDQMFTLTLADSFNPHYVTAVFEISAQPGDVMTTVEKRFVIGWPNMLLINASTNEDVGLFLASALTDASFPVFDISMQGVDGDIAGMPLDNYETIVYHSYDNAEDLLNEDDEAALISFLERSGRLVVSSPYLVTSHPESELLNDYMAVELAEEHVSGRTILSYDNHDIFTDVNLLVTGGEYERTEFQPTITANGDGMGILYIESRREDSGLGAVINDTDMWRTMYMSFAVEAISGGGESEELTTFLSRVKSWLDTNPMAVDSGNSDIPTRFVMEPAYPNPFNSTTRFQYSVPEAGAVTVQIYDIMGREIYSMRNAFRSAGLHQFSWQGASLPSGVYHVKVSGKSGSAIQSVVLMK